MGKLHNKSVKPKIENQQPVWIRINFHSPFTVWKVPMYMDLFLIGITLKDTNGNIILNRNGEELSEFPAKDIKTIMWQSCSR